MKEQLCKRPKRFFTRKAKTAGELGALPLGQIQPEKPTDWRKRFTCTPRGSHKHCWLFGTDNKVCAKCGLTVPKDQEVPDFTPSAKGL